MLINTQNVMMKNDTTFQVLMYSI